MILGSVYVCVCVINVRYPLSLIGFNRLKPSIAKKIRSMWKTIATKRHLLSPKQYNSTQ